MQTLQSKRDAMDDKEINTSEKGSMRPWENEPDHIEFCYRGFPCIIHRAHPVNPENPKDVLGHLCGYVGVPPSHPFHGKRYNEVPVEVHGGLTYAEKSGRSFCCEKGDAWWLGFDCAHLGDLVPGIWEMRQPGGILHEIHSRYEHCKIPEDAYRTIAYVKNEIRNMVKQLEKYTVLETTLNLEAKMTLDEIEKLVAGVPDKDTLIEISKELFQQFIDVAKAAKQSCLIDVPKDIISGGALALYADNGEKRLKEALSKLGKLS